MNTKNTILTKNIIISQHPDYRSEIVNILRSNLTPKLIRDRILSYHENDIAAAIELLNRDERNRLYSILDVDTLANVFEYCECFNEYIQEIGIRKKSKLFPD